MHTDERKTLELIIVDAISILSSRPEMITSDGRPDLSKIANELMWGTSFSKIAFNGIRARLVHEYIFLTDRGQKGALIRDVMKSLYSTFPDDFVFD